MDSFEAPASATRDHQAEAARGHLGLVVIWNHAREHDVEIEALIAERFDVLGLFENSWSPGTAERNFERLYCDRRWPGRGHVEQKGEGPFKMIVIVDHAPKFGWRETTQGGAVVNTNLFDAKAIIRSRLRKKLSVHISDNAREGGRDIVMMLGPQRLEAFRRTKVAPKALPPTEVLSRNTTGLETWGSLEEMFSVLNETASFVLLNSDDLVAPTVRENQSMELLTDSYHATVNALNARPILPAVPEVGGRFKVRLNGTAIRMDIRTLDDDYLPGPVAAEVLRTREVGSHNSYRLSARSRLLVSMYRVVTLSRAISVHDVDMLNRLRQNGARESVFADASAVQEFLASSLGERGIDRVPEPQDPSVYFNYRTAGYRVPWLRGAARAVRYLLFVAGIGFKSSFASIKQSIFDRLPWLLDIRRTVRKKMRVSNEAALEVDSANENLRPPAGG